MSMRRERLTGLSLEVIPLKNLREPHYLICFEEVLPGEGAGDGAGGGGHEERDAAARGNGAVGDDR